MSEMEPVFPIQDHHLKDCTFSVKFPQFAARAAGWPMSARDCLAPEFHDLSRRFRNHSSRSRCARRAASALSRVSAPSMSVSA